jgi:3-deoxy-D-manno-octulosonic-acid transferase
MREMPAWYALADVALLGGSFAPLGGQNLIEAAACGCPIVMGPHTFNFAEAAELSLAPAPRFASRTWARALPRRRGSPPIRSIAQRLAKAALSFARVHSRRRGADGRGIAERLRLGG